MEKILNKDEVAQILKTSKTMGCVFQIDGDSFLFNEEDMSLSMNPESSGFKTIYIKDINEAEIKDEFNLLIRIPISTSGDMVYYTTYTLSILQPVNIWDILWKSERNSHFLSKLAWHFHQIVI